jgi:flavin-binding protein dodecin
LPLGGRGGPGQRGAAGKNIRGAWIAEQKVDVENGRIKEYRVTMRVTFILEE